MLRVLGSRRKLCDGLTRREMLRAGGLSAFGLGLSGLLQQQAQPSESSLTGSFGKAKHCIVLFLYGSPSQLETFDMKPDAPGEVRGVMNPVASSLPGLDVCEYLPEMAKIMDRTTVVRSMCHPYPVHGVAYAMTGVEQIDVAAELDPLDTRHHPWFGSCVEYVDRQNTPPGRKRSLLQNVALPFPFSSQRSDQPFRAGPYGAFLERVIIRSGPSSSARGRSRFTRAGPTGNFPSPAPNRIWAARRRAISASPPAKARTR